MNKTMLIAGASGVVGRAALEYFDHLPDWRVIGLSRRAPDTSAGEHISLDLMDRAHCKQMLSQLSDVTHVIYGALFEKPGLVPGWQEQDQMQTNLQMLQNFLEPLEAAAPNLCHFNLLQGTKAYGAHVHPMKVPGKEREPRDQHENFYWLQEDYLRGRQQGKDWTFTIWRPPLIIGHALGAPMNVLSALGVYAAINREESKPLHWPGGNGGAIDAVDANLLAHAFAWAADNEAASNETFNVTNGDVFIWKNIWPSLAAAFDMEAGDEVALSLSETLPAKAGLWDEIRQKHQLTAPGLLEFTGDSLIYTDMFFSIGSDQSLPSPFLSTIKIRQAGFAECIDTEDSLVDWIRYLRDKKILP
ncbi:MAG: SDR family oxidoreductase [Pseudomonadota bacterium]